MRKDSLEASSSLPEASLYPFDAIYGDTHDHHPSLLVTHHMYAPSKRNKLPHDPIPISAVCLVPIAYAVRANRQLTRVPSSDDLLPRRSPLRKDLKNLHRLIVRLKLIRKTCQLDEHASNARNKIAVKCVQLRHGNSKVRQALWS